ncbi:MAG: uroporphyrinogen-III C-methyltransferase [Betaproteobacteria bacterium RIFCSPLOWO2_12_FULL_65_14]|nr:MAG: uroporphyrinogen-III C-methyltransferase [Betaproteobacteria bacterium RIFCSPLOWO2_12_FULL_65_14]
MSPRVPAADRPYFAAFLDLRGKPATVVGGGPVAAQKAEALLRSGARVTVVAPELCARLGELTLLGALRHEAKRFQPGDLVGAEIVIAATDDPSVNEAVSVAARALRIPVNVADHAALSSFIMPSVVDRAPMQIAISSAGASPVLARKVRVLIEAALPFALGRLAALAARFRPASKERYPQPDARRRFWEGVMDGPVAQMMLAGNEEGAVRALQDELQSHGPGKKGFVSLVGGGPGNPDLLTLRALRVLQSADVLLYDYLVAPAIVELARREAERIYVGKQRDNHALGQREINALMVRLAREGKHVVRLKGGDPLIFGRGGEEIEALAAEGIGFEIVPGVTAASGAASYAGIPLTHRDYAQSCVFATGHLKDGTTQMDWKALVRPRQTVVVYMGVHGIEKICRGLIEHGLAADTPAAVVEKATLPAQRVVEGTLASLPGKCTSEKAKPPALLIVGEVVRLRSKLAWYAREGVELAAHAARQQ